jgi:hypothetical protein
VEKRDGRAAKKLNLWGFFEQSLAAYSFTERANAGCSDSGTAWTSGAVRDKTVCDV